MKRATEKLPENLNVSLLEKKIFVRPKTKNLVFEELSILLKKMDQVSCEIQMCAAVEETQLQKANELLYSVLQHKFFQMIQRL